VLETALDAEMSEHLGYDKHDAVGRDGGNSRNCEYVGARCDGRADSSRNWFRALVPELSSGRSQRA
jgi:transposase-like protein